MKKNVALLCLLIVAGFCLIVLTKIFITPNQSDKEADNYYELKEKADVGEREYRLNWVGISDKKKDHPDVDEVEPNYVLEIDYSVKNRSKEAITVGTDIVVTGPPDEQRLKLYTDENTAITIEPQETGNVTLYYELNRLGEIKIQLAPTVRKGAEAAVYRVKLE